MIYLLLIASIVLTIKVMLINKQILSLLKEIQFSTDKTFKLVRYKRSKELLEYLKKNSDRNERERTIIQNNSVEN